MPDARGTDTTQGTKKPAQLLKGGMDNETQIHFFTPSFSFMLCAKEGDALQLYKAIDCRFFKAWLAAA